MNNKNLINAINKAGKAKSTVEFSCPYIRDFYVRITYANAMILQEIRDASREVRFDPRTRERQEELNEDKLREQYATKLISGWRGLTARKLKKLLPELTVADEELDRDISYEKELTIAILEGSLEFSAWVDSVATSIENFTAVEKKQEEELENLEE